ncbi:MAG: hypothetical protein GY774_20840 [Planctomycetes bacterium]|nr:hypothetical protein [Planctomycetota bacterium]
MPNVLTESSIIKCSNQGTVQLTAGQSNLYVNGSKVLVENDLNGKSISGCLTIPSTNTVTCMNVVTAINGVATKLKVNGKGVLLETINGQSSGTVSGMIQTWSVQSSGQSKLKAV